MQGNRAWLRLAVVLMVLAGTYVGLSLFLSSRVPPDTTVDGIAIGGMSPAEATVTLQRVLAVTASRPIRMEAPSRTVDIEPGTAGLEVDLAATLSDLTGFTLNPTRMWARLAGGESQSIKVRVDRPKLTRAVAEAARVVDSPVKEGSVTFAGGKATAMAPVPGKVVNVPETTDALASAWPGRQVVRAVMKVTKPTVSAAEINRAVREFAVPAMSGPVKVLAGEATLTLQPAQYAPAVSVAADGQGTLRPRLDGPRLLAAIRAVDPGMERSAVNATVRVISGKPRVVPAMTGMSLDVMAAPAPFLAALTSPTRTVTLPMVSAPPKVTTATAQGWGIKEQVSTFTTQFPSNPPRTNNIKIAVGTLNGTLVLPGDQFSLNGTLGPRSPAKGYQRAPVINAGRLVEDYGGGVSQVSTTTFNAAFFAGVKIEQYTPHSFYISRYPEGREATVSWPDVDQKWTNDTGSGILIDSFVSGNNVTVRFFGTKTWDIAATKGPRRNVVQPKKIVDGRASCVAQSPSPGFDVTVTRIFKRAGKQVKTSTFNTHYLPEDHVQCTHPQAG